MRDGQVSHRDSKLPKRGVIEFDSQCQSCNCLSPTERTVLLQSFKMACLSYKPNPVTLEDGQTVEREKAVEMQSSIGSDLYMIKRKQ